MTGYRYVVFGAGRQGTAAIYDLVKHCQARAVFGVEPNEAQRLAAESRLRKLLGSRASILRFASSASKKDLAGSDVVLSCASYRANVELTEMALAAGTPFCDLGGNPETVSAQEKLASKKSIPVVPDCGVSPGLSNILAVHCARVHKADSIEVRCGGLPLKRPDPKRNPLQYKLVFSPWGLISEYSGSVPVIRAGRRAEVEALSLTEKFDAEHESSPTSNNSPQVVDYLASLGVRDYNYMTVRYNGHWALARKWKSFGYLLGNSKCDAELAKKLQEDRALHYDPKKDRDTLILSVKSSRSENGLRRGFEYRLDVAADRKTRFSAMELMTCWGITIVAHHMASGRGKPKGFATPESFVNTAWVLEEIERRLKGLS